MFKVGAGFPSPVLANKSALSLDANRCRNLKDAVRREAYRWRQVLLQTNSSFREALFA